MRRSLFPFVVTILLLPGCFPFQADQQGARLLAPGKAEITPSYSHVSFSNEGETEHVQNQFGIRAGYGLSPKVELRGTIERASIVEVDDEDDDAGLKVIGIGAKFGLVPNRLSLYVPVGFMTGDNVDSGDTWTTVPTLLATLVESRTFELTPSLKAYLPLAGEDREAFWGIHLGAGISSDLSKWAVRPEIGVVKNPGDEGTVWGWTIGFSYRP